MKYFKIVWTSSSTAPVAVPFILPPCPSSSSSRSPPTFLSLTEGLSEATHISKGPRASKWDAVSPPHPQRGTEPFVELNASLPSRLSPSKHWRRCWDHNYAVPGKPISLTKPHQYTLSRRTHAEHVTHSWVSRADKSKAYAFKYMNTWLQLVSLHLFGRCRIEMQVFHWVPVN